MSYDCAMQWLERRGRNTAILMAVAAIVALVLSVLGYG